MVLGQNAEPQAMCAQAARHHGADVKLLPLSGCGAVDDDSPEFPATPQALCRVFTTQHLENGIYAFALSEFVNALLVINLAVVDAVIEAEFFHAIELFARGRRSEGLDPQQLADLHGRRAHPSADGM